MKENFNVSKVLSIIVIGLAIIASAGGVLIENLYRDAENIRAVWFANDLVTIFIAVPLFIGALIRSMKGSLKAQLVWVGTLWYMIYNYVFYVYGAVFNAFFLLYVALLILSAYALIFTMIQLDTAKIKEHFSEKTPVKWISGYLFFFATSLGMPWIMMSLSYILKGEAADFTQSVVFATDLTFLISVLIVGGILLWKKHAWGYIIAAMILIKGLLYPVVLLLGGLLAYSKTGIWDSFIPLYVFLWIGCMAAFIVFMKSGKGTA